MKRISKKLDILIYILLLFAISCKKENSNPGPYAIPGNLKNISGGYVTGAATRMEIYSTGALFVGYNKLFIALYDSATNLHITKGQISLSVVMKAGNISNLPGSMQVSNMSLSGPVENPSSTQADSGLFNAAIIFVRPSTADSAWTLTAQVSNLVNGRSGAFSSSVSVAQPSIPKAYSVITLDDSTSLFISLVQPENWLAGSNPFEVTIHKEINGLTYTPDGDYTMNINPIMPAMLDMSSPGNTNPVYIGNGHYLGKVNFTMTGEWQINISLLHNGALADTSHYFNINL